ncbi:MAG: class II aldolase/adducin family protein [Candidatus Brockarchaeota archaeon]|nr:class II aldolase/adducin family protein [Candidatus Brockarchaeota archaeon]
MEKPVELGKLLADLAKFSRLVYEMRLTAGPGGNTSARLPGSRVMHLKPSGLSFAELGPEDFVAVDIYTMKKVGGRLKPSSELALHAACYRNREDVNAVFHAHPAASIALGASGQNLDRPMYPDHVVYLGKVSFVPYVAPTTRELAEKVGRCAKRSNCVLLQNHGTVALGSSVKEAFYRTELMEESAKIALWSKIPGKARALSDEDVKRIEGLRSEAYRKKVLRK